MNLLKKEVFKKAWEIKKENEEYIFSLCLKLAWSIIKVESNMKEKNNNINFFIVDSEYYKEDGFDEVEKERFDDFTLEVKEKMIYAILSEKELKENSILIRTYPDAEFIEIENRVVIETAEWERIKENIISIHEKRIPLLERGWNGKVYEYKEGDFVFINNQKEKVDSNVKLLSQSYHGMKNFHYYYKNFMKKN